MNRKERRMAAKLGTPAVPFVAPGASVGHSAGIAELLRSALRHHQAGQLVEAECYYRRILAIDQNHFDALHLLGVIAHQSGNPDLAARLIGKAIALHDRNPAHANEAGSEVNALRRGKRAIGRRELAAAHSNLSIVLMALGNPVEALKAFRRSIQLDETENSKLLFVQCVQGLTFIPQDIDLRDDLARALSDPWGRPIDLARFAANLIKLNGPTGACIRRFSSACAERRPSQALIGPAELAEICRDRLLRCLLETTIVFNAELEAFLTAVRNKMLEAASGDGQPRRDGEDMLRFFCSLARQCFINEYVFACTEQEMQLAERLRGRLTNALASGEPIPEQWLTAVAAYFPLASLPRTNLLTRRRWSNSVAQLLALQVQEVEQEQQLRASVPQLTAIDGDVTLAVKQQYEESPYPRWLKASPVGKSTTIAAHLRQQFSNIDPRHLPTADGSDILIAGCGTGQQPIETARQFKGARVLAIDLSLTSLCYAKRKTRELGLKNIEYAQADILQLQALGRTFDVIEASGVLHHLAEPMEGWRLLLAILRPGGFMRLGLYSRLARQDLAAARTLIAQRGYGASAAEIRRCRAELMGFGHDTALAKVTDWSDFFSTSTCRDLLFHVQEHQMTLPEIGSFLLQNQLQFLGFVLPGHVRENFRRRFPNEGTMTDLARWHIFETENPTTFTGMYQFWIRKPQ